MSQFLSRSAAFSMPTTSSAPVTPAQSGKDLKRNLLLDAAYQVFTDNGYHRTRLEDVAARAGYSKASVYNYFEDKEELFLQTSLSATAKTVAALQAESQSDRPSIKNIECMLRYLLSDTGSLFSFVQAISEYHGEVQIPEIPKTEREKLAGAHLAGLRGILEAIAGAIEEGQSQGQFGSEIDPFTTARFLTGVVRSVLLRWRLDGRKSDLEHELSEIMTFASQGLGCKATKKTRKSPTTRERRKRDVD